MKITLRLIATFVLLLAGSIFILGWSQPGLRLLAKTAAGLTGGTVTYQAVSGTLTSAWEVENLHIHTPVAQISIGSVKAEWRPLQLIKKRLHVMMFAVQGVEVFFPEGQDSEEPETQSPAGPISLPALRLPVAVLLDSIRIENAKLSSTSFPEIASIEHLYLSISGRQQTFELEEFDLSAKGYSAKLAGTLDTAEGWQVKLGGDAAFSGYGVGPLVGRLHVAGPLEHLTAHVELDSPTRATVDGEITGLPNDFQWQADLEIEKFQLEEAHDILPEMMIGVKGPAHGDLENYSATLQGNMDYLFFDDVDFQIELSGNYDQIEFPRVIAANARGKADLVDGLLSWDKELLWRGTLELFDFDPSQLPGDYPGRISLGLVSSGTYTREDGLRLVGEFSDIRGKLRGFPLTGKGKIEISESTIRLNEVDFASNDAGLQLSGMMRMAEGLDRPGQSLEWQADVAINDVNPSLFFADYPGRLSGRVSSSGVRLKDSLTGEVHIDRLEGIVRDYPVEGRGELLLGSDQLELNDVLLKSGTSEMRLAGSAGDELDLSVALSSPDLSEFLVELGGEVSLAGRVLGTRQKPNLTANLRGSKIRYREYAIESIKAQVEGGLEPQSTITGMVEASGLRTGGEEVPVVDKVKLNLEGLVDQHELTGLVQVNENMADFILKGGLAESFQWDGELQRFRLTGDDIGTWGQQGTAPLSLSAGLAQLGSFCLADGGERVCLSAMWKGDDQAFSADFGWQDIELARLRPFIPLKDPIWGKTSADFTFGGTAGRLEIGSGLLAVTKAGIGHRDEQADEDWERTDLDSAVLRVNLDGENLVAQLESYFADKSSFVLDAEVSNMDSFAKGLDALPLRGVVEADIRSLDFVAPLTDYHIRPSGSLYGILDLAGTVAAPVITGNMNLADGVLDLPDLGISLKNVKFAVRGAENGATVSAEATSGEGWLKAQGHLRLEEDGMVGDFAFTGESFDAVLLPEYAIQASPDLRLQFNSSEGRLTGKLHIPSAQLMPKDFKAAVNESGDVIFVNGEDEEKSTGWQFGTSLLISLGNEVRLSGYGLSGNLVGGLQLDMVPGSVMTGKGELSLEDGVFSVYGRSLDLVRSKLLFSGGSIENPGVDARAEKVVSVGDAKSEVVEVGVDVTGTVENLEFVLFSDPPMDDTDILAYMVIGRSMSSAGQQDENLLSSAALALGLETSVGLVDRLTNLLPIDELYIEGTTSEEMSLVVGKKLTKELYIGYDHNFFDQLGEWLLRYDLGKGFSVETRSSTEATGADILYSFER